MNHTTFLAPGGAGTGGAGGAGGAGGCRPGLPDVTPGLFEVVVGSTLRT